ncbi:hypothetical protein CVT26_015970 [Gymnopilus dilepis]|uniref:Uncharacterized protein n=1 Tax=Gymnopilus dilepis TaxID=231916 RepID=A0A409XYI4_9AGAR|nr:hypothetical protein CVT26_015970 [Gymnopilus dilepis]
MGEYDNVLGPLILAVFINTYFSGIVGFQYLSYQYKKYPDSYALKALVLALWFVDGFQIAATVYMSWLYCVTNYLNPTAMSTVALWTYTVIPLCNAFSGIISHSFVTHKLWKSRNKITLGALVSLSIAAFALAAASGIYGITQHISMVTSLSSATLYRHLVLSWLCLQACVDIMLSVLLMLPDRPRRSGLPNDTLPWITQIVSSLARSGIYNSIFSTASLVIFLASSKTNIYMVFVLPLGRLYSLTVLTTLLGRPAPSTTSNSQSVNDVSKDFQFAVIDTTRTSRSRHESFSLIQIKTEREIVIDDGNTDGSKPRLSNSRRPSDLGRRSGEDGHMDKIPEIIADPE